MDLNVGGDFDERHGDRRAECQGGEGVGKGYLGSWFNFAALYSMGDPDGQSPESCDPTRFLFETGHIRSRTNRG